VLVAGNPTLQAAIQNRFHKSYTRMNAAEQSNVLNTLGIARELDDLAQQIRKGEIRPGRLAFLMDDDAARKVRTQREPAASEPVVNEPAPAANISRPQQRSFVDRLGVQPREREGFVTRVISEGAASHQRAI